MPITDLARTVVDGACEYGLRAGIVAADAALDGGLLTTEDLRNALARVCRRTGVATAARVVALARPGAESVLESLARLLLFEHRIAEPELQRSVRTDRGRYRVDMLWPRLGLIVEVDGRAKYRETSDLWNEKKREDALRRAGWNVERIT